MLRGLWLVGLGRVMSLCAVARWARLVVRSASGRAQSRGGPARAVGGGEGGCGWAVAVGGGGGAYRLRRGMRRCG